MRRSVTQEDLTTFAQLDMVYNKVRVLEAKQNSTEFKCLGSGRCCHIGLVIPMMECAHIAFRLIQEYYQELEMNGEEEATRFMERVIASLKERMHDETWQAGGETEEYCAFYAGGCSIYGYRPLVCRSFGTITSVDNYCPRIRNAEGNIDYFGGPAVRETIQEYQDLIARYVSDKATGYDVTVYMPLGVLSFLLTDEELEELADTTDEKFWSAVVGWFNYRVEFVKAHGHSRETIEEESKRTNIPIAFKFQD